MGSGIDEDIAWALVRAAVGSPAGRVAHPVDRNLWVETDPSGSWRASGPTTDEARELLDIFLPLAVTPGLVIAQLGQSLDGRIATEAGQSHYVTGMPDIRRLHRLRALVDAVVVGAETVAQDDPRLTVREVEGANPTRVILDSKGLLSTGHAVFTDGAAPTILVCEDVGAREFDPAAVEVVRIPLEVLGGFDPAAVLEELRTRGLRRILIEGGGVTVSRFLQARVLDRLHICVAPLLIGSGRPAITLPVIQELGQAIRPRCRHFHLGEDVLFDLDLR
jgi:riboflavin-specific deaminase-like protein